MIPFNRAVIGSAEISAVSLALQKREIVGNGPAGKRTEAELEQVLDSARVLLTTSCTHALEMSARLAEVKPNDEVIVPAYTFVSTANAFALAGARIVFADVSRETLNVTPETVAPLINERTKAICIVHYAGVAAEPDRFVDLAAEHDLTLIEDNAHGLFGHFKSKPLGSFAPLSTLSFHETKNISCGEGGALVINDEKFVDRAELLREKGTNRARFLRGQVDKYTWVDEGSSWVLSDILAAVLEVQLKNAPNTQARRGHVWKQYSQELKEWAEKGGFRLPTVPINCEHPAHLFYVRLTSQEQRDAFISHMRSKGVSVVFHYQALSASPYALKFGARIGQCPEAEAASGDLVRLPLFGDMTDDELDHVVNACQQFTG